VKTAEDKIIVYLMRHPTGVSGSQIDAWLDSCRKDGGFTYAEMCDAKRTLRDQGRIVCTNRIWWLKDIPTATKEAAHERKQLAKRRVESRTIKRTG
jgi:hypothetical protein